MPDKDEKKPSAEVYGEKVGSGYLVGGQAETPISRKMKLTMGYNKVLGQPGDADKSIKVSKETKGGNKVSLGYSSGKNISAEYQTKKGNTFSASYNPQRGALISARINLSRNKK